MIIPFPVRRLAPMRNWLAAPALAAALLLASPLITQAQGAPATPVQSLDDGLLSIMRQGRATPFAERVQALTPIVEQAFNLRQILQSSVGPRFASIPPAKQAELLDAFTAFTVASYVANFDAYNGERFDVLPETRKVGSDVVVQTRIVPQTGDPTKLDYVVRGDKVVDILLDGSISRVAVQRSDFRSLIGSGDPQPLISMLRNKTAGLAAGDKG
jgi:phospholipid transport system substrate-binding protein